MKLKVTLTLALLIAGLSLSFEAFAQSYIPANVPDGINQTFNPIATCNNGDFIVFKVVNDKSKKGLLQLKRVAATPPWDQVFETAIVKARYNEKRDHWHIEVESPSYSLNLDSSGISSALWKRPKSKNPTDDIPPQDAFDDGIVSSPFLPAIEPEILNCAFEKFEHPAKPTGFSAGN